jgi:large subunit ribosomal protein L17
MNHRTNKHSFGRRHGPRLALIKGLVGSLVEHERIKTTLAKAKEVRKHVERAITKGKRAGDTSELHTIRVLSADYPRPEVVKKIVSELAVRFKTRPGGYTRILKLGQRNSDGAPMAYLELVDFQPKAKAGVVADDKAVIKAKRAKAALKTRTKKRIRAISVSSRRKNQK